MLDTLQQFGQSLGIANLFGRGFWSVVLTFLTAAVFTWRFIPAVRAFAMRVGWADLPNERRLNTEPLPNAGGLAIFAGFIVSVVVAWALRPIVIEQVQIQVLAILLGGALLVLTGFIDDQYGLSPLFRLLVQTLAAVLLVVNGLHIDLSTIGFLPDIPKGILEPLNIFITVVWIVGITNAVNLLDGVDGVVGGVAFVASTVLLATAAQFFDRAAAVILLAGVAGATLAYLRYNFNPSRIIMGDAGSTLLGFTLAAVSLLGTLKLSAGTSLLAPLLFLALPILDTTQVVLGRLARGIRNPLAHPDKTHLHHRLLSRTDARRTAVIMWAVTLLFGVLGMLAQRINPLAIVAVALLVSACLVWVMYRRVRALNREARESAQPK